MGIEQEALHFTELIKQVYFVERDAEQLFTLMCPYVSWIGTGDGEIGTGIDNARVYFEGEMTEYNEAFDILQQDVTACALSDTVCVIYGFLRAAPVAQIIEEQLLHITVVCVKTPDGIKLAHCHISRPDYLLEQGTSYLAPQVRADNVTLRDTLATREQQLRDLICNIPGGVHQCLNDPNLTLISISDSFLELFGYSEAEIKSRFDNKFINMIYPDDRAEILRSINHQLNHSMSLELEYRVMSKNNGPIWILDKCRLMVDKSGKESFYCVLVEITQRKKEQEQLRLSLERHSIIMDQATDIIFEWDIAADTLDFSTNWRKKFGYDPIISNISSSIPKSDNIYKDDMPAFIKVMHDTAAGTPYCEAEFRIRDINGQFSWNRIRATAQFDSSGRCIKAVGVITDISAEKEERLALLEQAQRDALTGLYNKAAIKAQVERYMGTGKAAQKQAMMIIDVDGFKQVNDTYGHLCGDTLLSDVAQILKHHFRATDVVGRIGGDEFLVYLPDVPSEAILCTKAEQLLTLMGNVRPAPNAPPCSCSIGVAVLPRKSADYFNLYHCADRALYHRKNNGKNGISFYDPSMHDDNFASDLAQSAVSESIESERLGAVEQKLAQYMFQMLYQSIDVETAVNQLLEIVGRSYAVSRAYIFESSEDNLCCNNTFEWCAPGIEPEIDNLQGIRYKEDLGNYLDNFNEDGVFYCHDINTLNPNLYNILAPQGIRSLLQCAVLDRGQFKGYVGFDECRENCLWNKEQVRSLTLIANVLSVFLIKLRLEEKIARQEQDAANCTCDGNGKG